MAGEQVVREPRAEEAHNYIDGNVKANLCFFASICGDGKKFPLNLIARGKK
jgi:hypothetical protein